MRSTAPARAAIPAPLVFVFGLLLVAAPRVSLAQDAVAPGDSTRIRLSSAHSRFPSAPVSVKATPAQAADLADGLWEPLGLLPRFQHAAVYDPVRNRIVITGGAGGTLGDLSDVRTLPLEGTPVWATLTVQNAGPAGRAQHSAIYDPVRDRILLFGGQDNSGAYNNDVWELPLSGTPTWRLLTPSGVPPAGRCGHTAVYDPVGDRMVVFGGAGRFGYFNDVWALSLADTPEWTALTPAGTPAPRSATPIWGRTAPRSGSSAAR